MAGLKKARRAAAKLAAANKPSAWQNENLAPVYGGVDFSSKAPGSSSFVMTTADITSEAGRKS